MDGLPPEELLESVHSFPGSYQIKAIGEVDDDFPGRVLAAVLEEVSGPGEVDLSLRETKGGRHVAVTMAVTVQSSRQVLAIYARIREVRGLTLLL